MEGSEQDRLRPVSGLDVRRAERKDRMQAWLEAWFRRGAIPRCPLCGNAEWSIDDVVELREFREGRLIMGAPVLPAVPVTCERCGYMRLFNAIVAGVVEGDEE